MCALSFSTGDRLKADHKNIRKRKLLAAEIEESLRTKLLEVWYPQCLDKEYGGYLTGYTHDFKPEGDQQKMIVTQARHAWVNAKASLLYPDQPVYREGALHGFNFLKDVMWDEVFGGFYTLLSREGAVIDDSKNAYGNAFGIFALAACWQTSKDAACLDLAQKAFYWLEKNSHDPVYKGYYQHLRRDGSPIRRDASVPSYAETGYKDQNSSIHLLEALTELYLVWPDALLAERLRESLFLIRDTIVTDTGYMTLFFTTDWHRVSFRHSSREVIDAHYDLDHVSFGHDVETAYLLLEASRVLGMADDVSTTTIAKRMVDHAIENGWDDSAGGFYDAGYYYNDNEGIAIVKDSKNWWAQAEGLNTLLVMADKFPEDKRDYFSKFERQWDYIKAYVIDPTYGDWYAGGLDKEPFQKTERKGHAWKATYHQFRAMASCIQQLRYGKDV